MVNFFRSIFEKVVVRVDLFPHNQTIITYHYHADRRTTKLYDRRRQQITRGEVERIRYEKKQPVPEEAR